MGARAHAAPGARAQWLLIKHRDELATAKFDVVAEVMTSVKSGRTMEEIAERKGRVWRSNRTSDTESKPRRKPAAKKSKAKRSSSAADQRSGSAERRPDSSTDEKLGLAESVAEQRSGDTTGRGTAERAPQSRGERTWVIPDSRQRGADSRARDRTNGEANDELLEAGVLTTAGDPRPRRGAEKAAAECCRRAAHCGSECPHRKAASPRHCRVFASVDRSV